MITATSGRDHPRYGKIGYGFGIQVFEKEGFLEVSHSGYIDGYTSTLLYYPQTKISVIILENISWDVKDMKRAFLLQDHIREIVRSSIHKE